MAKLVKLWTALHTSYWFVPALMSVAAGGLSFALAAVDGWLGNAWISHVPWVYRVQASGARDILTTVAGSMIGVAGVTFSITIAALSYTTTTLGPRLLTNFMSDKGNQVTLGTFVSAFVYCVLLLRTVQADDGTGAHFVPHLAIAFAIVLAMAGLAVLIYFIHHITESLHVSNVIGDIADELNETIETLDQRAAEDDDETRAVAALPADFAERAVAVPAETSGYVQNIVYGNLIRRAQQADLVIRLTRVPGDFVARGQALARVWPGTSLDETARADVREAFALGRRRTQSQDVLFLVNELVEIAARALSPGTNDPYTAMSCLDWLAGALDRLACRRTPAPTHHDSDGTLRVWAPVFDFATLADAIYDQLRPYFATDINAAIHMFDRLGEAGVFIGRSRDRGLLHDHADALFDAMAETPVSPRDRDRIERAWRRATRRLTHPADRTDALAT